MTQKMLTITNAAKAKQVTRQAIYLWLQREDHLTRCEKIASSESERPIVLLIPESLLDTYTPSQSHQERGLLHSGKPRRRR